MVMFLGEMYNNTLIKVLVVLILLDSIFGIARAIKSKKVNSSIGIDGLIRKVLMLVSTIAMKVIDLIVNINLISFIPDDVKSFLNVETSGLCEIFGIIFIFFEFISVLKNMALCKLPIPKKLQEKFEKLMNSFTTELENK